MADWKLTKTDEVSADNPIAHDLHFGPDGDIVWADNQDAIAQRIKIRLQMFRGEWFADERQGMPWFEDILIKPAQLPTLRAILTEAISTVPGVISVKDVALELNRETRTLSGRCDVVVPDGEILDVGFEVPFVVNS